MGNVLWAAAVGGWWDRGFVVRVMQAFYGKLPEASPGSCAQVLIAAAKCQAKHPMLLGVVARLAATAGQADMLMCANALWAVAKLDLACQA